MIVLNSNIGEELSFVSRLVYKHYQTTCGLESLKDTLQNMQHYFNSAFYTFLFIEDQEELAGFSLTGPIHKHEGDLYKQALQLVNSPIELHESHQNLCMISVLDKHQGKGMGTKLLEETVNRVSKSYEQLWSMAWRGKGDSSYYLHKNSGFTEIATLQNIYADKSAGTVFVKELG